MRDYELPGRSAVHAIHGMVVTPNPLASLAALEILKSGGNAMDGAIAASATLGVVEPAMSGIGGDCVVLIAPKGKAEAIAYLGLGRAPAAANLDWYRNAGIDRAPPFSAHMVAVPGLVDSWVRLAADHGTIGLDRLLAPAIAHAEGYPVSDRVARDWEQCVPLLAHDPHTRAQFVPHGRAPRPGALHRRPALAATLRRIAALGRDGFYKGPVAEDIVGYLRGLGGLHTLEDFETFSGEYAKCVETRYRGHAMIMPPPPSLGILTLLMLNILARFDFGGMDPLSADRLHLEIEASRLAYAERATLGADGAFDPAAIARMVSPSHGATLAAHIRPGRTLEGLPGIPKGAPAETTYISVVDRDRNAVSFMATIVDFFGSRLTAPDSGVLLNNRGEYFTTKAADPNAWASRKRPLSFSLPGILAKDDHSVMSFGIVGGSYQPVGMAHIATNVLDFGMDAQEALTLARAFSLDGVLDLERGISESVALDLAARGHKVVRRSEGPRRENGPLGAGQAIWIDREEGTLAGGADPRKDSAAIGY